MYYVRSVNTWSIYVRYDGILKGQPPESELNSVANFNAPRSGPGGARASPKFRWSQLGWNPASSSEVGGGPDIRGCMGSASGSDLVITQNLRFVPRLSF